MLSEYSSILNICTYPRKKDLGRYLNQNGPAL